MFYICIHSDSNFIYTLPDTQHDDPRGLARNDVKKEKEKRSYLSTILVQGNVWCQFANADNTMYKKHRRILEMNNPRTLLSYSIVFFLISILFCRFSDDSVNVTFAPKVIKV